MNNKQNTAVICLSPFFGGMEMDAFDIAKTLCHDVDITLIVKRDSLCDTAFRDEAQKLPIRYETIKYKNYFSFSIIYHIRRIFRLNKIQNSIYYGASEMKSLFFSFLGLNINQIIRHGTTKSSPKKDFLHRLFYSKVHWHVGLSKHILRNVEYIIPFGKHSKGIIIYPSLRYFPEITHSTGTSSSDTVNILHVSRIVEAKGHIDTINACAILYENNIDFKLTFVGNTNHAYFAQVKKTWEQKPYKSQIEFTGFVDNIRDYYQAADLFVFPSLGEGLSNSFIEGLAYGLGCIAYANTSFPELKELGFDFFLAENNNLDELKSGLLAAARSSRSVNGHNMQLTKSLFSRQREKQEFLDLLL